MTANHRPRIVVLGAGFGGLSFCQAISHPSAEITLIDRQNHHLFQPLLYQVATAGLSALDTVVLGLAAALVAPAAVLFGFAADGPTRAAQHRARTRQALIRRGVMKLLNAGWARGEGGESGRKSTDWLPGRSRIGL